MTQSNFNTFNKIIHVMRTLRLIIHLFVYRVSKIIKKRRGTLSDEKRHYLCAVVGVTATAAIIEYQEESLCAYHVFRPIFASNCAKSLTTKP